MRTTNHIKFINPRKFESNQVKSNQAYSPKVVLILTTIPHPPPPLFPSKFLAAPRPRINARLQIYSFFELAKFVTALIALATKGPDSEVVRLSVKAFRKHLTLLGGLLGFNSLHQEASGAAGDLGATSTSTTSKTVSIGWRYVSVIATVLAAAVAAVIIVIAGAAAVRVI